MKAFGQSPSAMPSSTQTTTSDQSSDSYPGAALLEFLAEFSEADDETFDLLLSRANRDAEDAARGSQPERKVTRKSLEPKTLETESNEVNHHD